MIIRLHDVSMTKIYQMMKTKIWNIDQNIYQLYYLSNLLEKNGVGKNRQIAPRWQARDCNDDVLKVTALCCSIIIYSFFCSQSIYLNLCTRDRAGASERMQSEQIGERGKSSF